MTKHLIRNIEFVPGFLAAGVPCGIKPSQLKDLALIVSDVPAVSAGLFTKNKVPSPSVVLSRNILNRKRTTRALLIISGNANACTGKQGIDDCRKIIKKTEQTLGIGPQETLIASTGIIGVPLPRKIILEGIPRLADKLSTKGWIPASEAILTTDLITKTAQTELTLGKQTITIGGLAKGSGMIHPNMSTMLAFIVTDAKIGQKALQKALKEAVDSTFNSISVDGECSTNDSVIAFANGKAGNNTLKNGSKLYKKFLDALTAVCRSLAHQIVKDGEGATKFITVLVSGAKTVSSAKKIAQQVAKSNLVKTAMFGQDPNWGRIFAAAGNAGVPIQSEKIEIILGGIPLVRNGQPLRTPRSKLKAIMKKKSVPIELNLKQGKYQAKVYTCDLSYDYVRINAEYAT